MTLGIDQGHAFAPDQPFGSVVAARPAYADAQDALCVDDRHPRRGTPAAAPSLPTDQSPPPALEQALIDPAPEPAVALQLRFLAFPSSAYFAGLTAVTPFVVRRSTFEMGVLGSRLMRTSPERPRDDVGGLDAPLRQPHGEAADLLDRPADQ
ncbi:hypothetical protein [Methylobacterium pseudosasicola]|uniref:hypothetical protein n=1 Tax=Methylobacterium pseudosasicola TaxID=582667 RepID=UPI0014289F7A|nr:hypothetical protein [Methylobacterium pseudosasicola]